MKSDQKPLVSVCLITYNHSKYIRQAVESVLMQKVNFHWEFIIADDCSSDGTRDILLEYQRRNPEFIQLISQEKNVGPIKNFLDLIRTPKGKYIAYLEGDDYWTDELKLQKQITFLDKHLEYSSFAHQICRLKDERFFDFFPGINTGHAFNLSDIIEKWNISIGAIVFRKNLIDDFSLFKSTKAGDQALCLLLAAKGPIYYSPEVMGNYRLHEGGITSSEVDWGEELIDLLIQFDIATNNQYNTLIQSKLFELYSQKIHSVNAIKPSFAKYKFKTRLLYKLIKCCPDYIKTHKQYLFKKLLLDL